MKASKTPAVIDISWQRQYNLLEITFTDGLCKSLTANLLRTNSPSAEVQGHGKLPVFQKPAYPHVVLLGIEPIGHYAIKLHFDDGHASGIYTWSWLYQLAQATT